MAWQTALFNNILSDLLFNMASKADLYKAYSTCMYLFSTVHLKILLAIIEDVSILYLRFFGAALSVKLSSFVLAILPWTSHLYVAFT